MSIDSKSIAVDEKYNVRDNQFWYNDCKFRTLIENKSTICIRIEDFDKKEHTLTHSKQGIDGRTTLSYTLPHNMKKWWKENHGKSVKVELTCVHA